MTDDGARAETARCARGGRPGWSCQRRRRSTPTGSVDEHVESMASSVPTFTDNVLDSAYATYWNPTTLAPGASRSVTTLYGLSDVSVDLTPPLALGVSGPAALSVSGSSYTPNPFTVTATVSDVGTAAATGGTLELNLPPGLHTTSPNPVSVGNLAVGGAEQQASWQVTADPTPAPQTLTYSVTASASNTTNKTVSRTVSLPALSTCADAAFIAATGSDQHYTSATDLSISPQILKAYTGMRARLVGRRSVSVQVLNYPALSVSVLLANLSGNLRRIVHQFLDVNLPKYLASKNQGVSAMWGAVTGARFSCPKEKLVLAGYSQGAMVVHEFLDQLASTNDTATKAAIRGVLLIADPERVKNSQTLEYGDASYHAYGICDYASIRANTSCTNPLPLTDVPRPFLRVTTDLCLKYDIVCDTSELFHDFGGVNTVSGYKAAGSLGMTVHTGQYQYDRRTTSAGVRVASLLLATP